ncbi:MAG: HEPN domain-containing protein [Planctomycetes bacterium]|nr:HEPN domain-containing protein [Planctomycetota bacterium]
MGKLPAEWLAQADYDFDTAEYMFRGGRYIYAVFMAHLAIEKGLKAIWQAKLAGTPPKIHNLLYLVQRIGVTPPQHVHDILATLSGVSVPTRYPDNLQKVLRDYTEDKTRRLLVDAKEALTWIRTRL